MKPILLFAAALAATPATAALIATGIYDEQSVQTNAVDFSMPYSDNTNFTTGIGLTLGAAQIRTDAEFKPLVEAAFADGRGGVITFDGVDNADYSQVQSFSVSFAGGTKGLTFANRIGGHHSIAGPGGDRTAISGSQYLGTGGNPHFDLDLTDFTGFGPNEKITAIGVTLLGRNNQGTGRNYRVIARYTNGVADGSSATFRSLDMQAGNTTQDSFSGIVAPTGFWITSIRVQSDSGTFTSLDDLAFITSDVINADQKPSIVTDLPATLEAALNSTVNLSVVLDSATSPPPTWQWDFDAAPEDGSFEPVSAEDGGTNAALSFISGPASEGTYRVTATNSEGNVTSGHGKFRVLRSAPVITTDLPQALQPLEGETVVLSVVIDPATYPAPTYQWFFDDLEIPAAAGGTNPSLTIIAGSGTDGLYYVDVENSEDVAFSNAVLVEFLADTDRDGIPDIDESGTGIYVSPQDTGTDPQNPDSDGDGLLDGASITVTSADPRHAAWAADGISFTDNGDDRTFLGERAFGTDPNNPDTDGDGLLDGNSITVTSADPRHAEWAAAGILFTDNGGQRTFLGELDFGTDPLNADTDGDGIPDGQEVADGTNPRWYQNALEWRPGGVPGGGGTWDAISANWFDGETEPGNTTVWDSAKTGLFPHPAGAVSVVGSQQANRLVFRHTGGVYNVNAAAPGDTLGFIGADPLVQLDREARFNLPVSGSFTLDGISNILRLTTDNSASLAGATIRVASGQLRGQDGAIGVGNELGGATTTVTVEAGAQIRFFNTNEGTRDYPQTLRLAGAGFGNNPGALNNDSNAANNIQWSGPIILDADARISNQNAGTWTFANIHDDGAGDKVLRLTQTGNTTDITGDVSLGGLLKDGAGTLNFTATAGTTLGTLTLGGGTVRLNAPEQLAAGTGVIFTNAGATLDLNGHDQTIANLAGPGSVAGSATLTVTGSLTADAPGQTLNVTGNLLLAGAGWQVSANENAASRINVQGNLDLDETTIEFTAAGLAGEVYVIASYATLSGTPTVENLPAGYTLDFAYDSGTAIALVSGGSAGNYASWASANGIAGQAFDGDFDGDGLPNGLEYAIAGLNPSGPDGSPGTLANGTLTFTKRAEAVANGDVTYTIETSLSLAEGSWTPVTPDVNNATTISYTLPAGQGKLFARLLVARIP